MTVGAATSDIRAGEKQSLLESACAVAGAVVDPELPGLTLEELGVLRSVDYEGDRLVVSITPTYSGCPAIGVMRADLLHALHRAGHGDVEVRTVLSPAWSSDDVTVKGREKLRAGGINPPHAVRRTTGAVPLTLEIPVLVAECPNCGSGDTESVSTFGTTACRDLRRCRACMEPFEGFKTH